MLRDEMARVYRELRRIRSAGEVDEGLAWTVDFLAREFSAMRGEAEPSDVEREDALIFGVSRRRGTRLPPAPSAPARSSCAQTPLCRGYGTPLMDGPHFPSASPARPNRVYFSHCEKP